MKKSIRLVAAAVCLLFTITAAGCAGSTPEENVDTLRYADTSYDSENVASGVVLENDSWQLVWDDAEKEVSFVEKATGYVWSNAPAEVNEDSGNKKNVLVESPLHVYYHYPANMTEEILSFNKSMISSYEADVYTQKLDNGLRVIYDFLANEIAVPVDYVLEGDHFSIAVDPAKIADNGKEYVTAVSVAPFIGAVKNETEDHWLFIPDGTGAIVEPNVVSTTGDINATDNMIRFYDGDPTIQEFYYTSVTEALTMPVLGAKKGDHALFAIIDEGAEASSLAWRVGSSNMGYSAAYNVFRFRGYSLMSPPRGYATIAAYIKVFENRISAGTLKMDYYALNGANANLSGMADVYRNYLIKEAGLQKSAVEQKSVAVKYVGGVEQPSFVLGLPTTKLFPLTTTEQANTMTTELAEKLGNDFYVDLVGFGQSGMDAGVFAGGFTVANEMGGESGLQELAGTMDTLGVDWYMDFNLIGFQSGSNGFSDANNGARWLDGQTAYFTGFNEVKNDRNANERYYMLARKDLSRAADTLLSKAAALKLKGISLGSVSNTVYSDFDERKTVMCGNIQEDVATILANVDKAGYNHLGNAANDYAAVGSDVLIDTPLYSSGYDIIDKDVPFYQMVLRGYVPMNSVSINLCADERDAMLRCVSAGVAPSYTLTYNYDNELITNKNTIIFGSSYNGNKDKVVAAGNDMKDYLNSIDGATVTGYDILTEDVRVTRFSNGVYTVVNFGKTAATTAYGTVEAGSWITGVQE